MPQNPSWKWMSPRPTVQDMARGAAASRPCLPAMEQLGDRVMLSGDVEVIANPDATVKVEIDQILIGLIKGELQETSTELSLLKIVADADPRLAHKFTAGLLKIDDVLYKTAENLIKGESKDDKHLTAIADIQNEFNKLDALIGGLPELGDIKIVLDQMESKATELLGALSKIEVVNDLSYKEQQTFLKITDAFGDLDAGLLKVQENLVAFAAKGKHIIKAQLQYLEVKFEDLLVSSRQVNDKELEAELNFSIDAYKEIMTRLLLPAVDEDVTTLE